MRDPVKFLLLFVVAAMCVPVAHAERTVCTITVNSADEKEAFRRHLKPDNYRFVELVERERPDWLASACQKGVRCDVLVISGHYDGGNEFFSDQLTSREFLPVAEMERVSCSNACPGLFSQLKEVYLFGCNTLNPEANKNGSAEIIRSLVRDGRSPADAERLARSLNVQHGESSRDRMRLVFKDVPVIYGFSSVAPLGPIAASKLRGYFQSTGTGEIGSGHSSSRMLGAFSSNAMAATRGMTDADPNAGVRRDVCQFADDRMTDANRLAFIHQLLRRPMAEVRMFFDRIEQYMATLSDDDRKRPETLQALNAIVQDASVRDRFLHFARDADQPSVRVRMLEVARNVGWLSAPQLHDEHVAMLGQMLARPELGSMEVDVVCALNADHGLDGAVPAADSTTRRYDDVGHAAISACLGNAEAHTRTVKALLGPDEANVRIAQTYVRHRPIADIKELRMVTAGIGRMSRSDAQVRALQALAQQHLTDPETLEELTRQFPAAESWSVQSAIAGVLIRADYRLIARPEIVRSLKENRRKSPYGADVIDALLRRLQMP